MRPVLQLFRTLILRPLRRDLLRTSLTVLAVALGVAVVIATSLAGDAATGSFLSSLETLVGRTDLEIVANGGVDETWVGRLAALPVNATFAPVIETQAVIEGTGSVTVYGIDAVARWRDGDGAVISTALARRLRLEKNGKLSLTLNDAAREFRVVDIVAAKDAEFVLLDIAAAQQALNEYGRLDRIEVFAGPRGRISRRSKRAIRADAARRLRSAQAGRAQR